jgi:hypothetical protein
MASVFLRKLDIEVNKTLGSEIDKTRSWPYDCSDFEMSKRAGTGQKLFTGVLTTTLITATGRQNSSEDTLTRGDE